LGSSEPPFSPNPLFKIFFPGDIKLFTISPEAILAAEFVNWFGTLGSEE